MSTTHSQSIFETIASRIFGAVTVCTLLYAWLFIDFSPIQRMRVVVDSESPAGTAEGSLQKVEIPIIADHNDQAPVSADDLEPQSTEEYIDKYAPVAIAEMKKYGIPASISMGQAIIESRAGTSLLAQKCKNHFGIKCWSKQHKGCCMKFKDDNNNDSFRHFEKSAWESWRAHSKLLSSGRYEKLHIFGSDYKRWAYGLKSVGYATDKHYAEKLIGIIERYDLNRLDK